MSEQTQSKRYKDTLNLPKTGFPMKANLVQREPQFQKRWDRLGVYQRMREARWGAEPFVLHDGPPYANGPIHLGHLLNKVLKDLVVRSRFMLGYDTPFVPGWDCHGLPIEHKIIKELGEQARSMETRDIRRRCAKDAEKFIKTQAKQMQRLGTVGDYEHPYITMDPGYEGATLEVFADLVQRGLVYRSLKPVHWSIENQTALADAELEYHEKEDTAVYVLFGVENPEALPDSLMARPGEPVSLLIWTTTPWTLPANLAVAVGPRIEYGLYRFEANGVSGLTLVATDLAEHVLEKAGGYGELLGTCTGAELEAAELRYQHPFVERSGPVVTAEYVTVEDGTGLVHTAPGHGVEDYQTGTKHGLETYCPVRGDGTFDESVPKWLQGRNVWEANDDITQQMRDSGHLLHDERFRHSYPHDWRSKTPVIFRATKQWFVGVDKQFSIESESDRTPRSLRDRAIENVESLGYARTSEGLSEHERRRQIRKIESHVRFYPGWGRNRMRGMLESRPDWCISRQRAWGLPIPAFFGPEEGQVLSTPKSVRAVAKLVREKGSDVWFAAPVEDLLQHYDPGSDDDAPEWARHGRLGDHAGVRKSTDIFDVWFESGSSWRAVLNERDDLPDAPADLYLEGSDQHRGWFQLSLLPALGVTGLPPYKAILTHGFLVDAHGMKMSKSAGNALEVEDLLQNFGADICRWWVASSNTENDVKAGTELFKAAGEEYRKVRNTVRFLLANLRDFDPSQHRRELSAGDARSIDAWAHGKLARLIERVRGDYDEHEYRRVRDELFHFCNETMSAVYLTAVKDRLYCDPPGSDRRRRTQTVLYDVADALIRLIAPILPHTADEAYLALHGEEENGELCVHTQSLPEAPEAAHDARWSDVMELRDRVMKALEDARAYRGLDNPLDAEVEALVPGELHEKVAPFADELADLCGVSRFTLDESGGGETVSVHDISDEPRCQRSWKRDGTVRERSDGGWLSDRDAAAVGVS